MNNTNCSGSLHIISFEGFCFLFFDALMVTWYEAVALCRERGTTLAAIELEEIYEMFQDNFKRSSGQWGDGVRSRERFWIGLRRSKWISTNTGEDYKRSIDNYIL